MTDPERLGIVESALLACVAQVQAEGPSEAEVDRARRYLLGGLSHELETASSRASSTAVSSPVPSSVATGAPSASGVASSGGVAGPQAVTAGAPGP